MKPLISLCVVAYNQDQFVAEAIESAFQQTYSPLEIVLSDDCSKDKTFEIMSGMAERYRGPHRVKLNRNSCNSGVAAHINRAMRMAEGELILAAAGDDVSLPNRASIIWETWHSAAEPVAALHSRVIHIDEAGKPIEHSTWRYEADPTNSLTVQTASASEYVRTLEPGIFGCAAAWTPRLFKEFGDLPGDLTHEDSVLGLRAFLLGKVLYLDTPLVKYRLHGNNIFNPKGDVPVTMESIEQEERKLERKFARRAVMYRVFGQDLATANRNGVLGQSEYSSSLALARRGERISALQAKFLGSGSIRKLPTLVQLARAGATGAQLRKLLIRVLPVRTFHLAKLLKGRLQTRKRSSRSVSVASQVGTIQRVT
jgi:glycosyltransferase involved in cell wall biosynthesis